MTKLDIDAYDFLNTEQKKALGECVQSLLEKRGTKEILILVSEIVVGQSVKIREIQNDIDLLFEGPVGQVKERQLYAILRDVMPVWSGFRVIDLSRQNALDSYTMLDENAVLLDEEHKMDSDLKLDASALK